MPIDQKDALKEEPFDYEVYKDGKLNIFWNGRSVMILKGEKANALIKKLGQATPFERQLHLAKVTGNFKRGNEKMSK